MTAPTLRSVSTAQLTTGTGNTYAGSTSGAISIPMPSGTVDGDVLVAKVAGSHTNSITVATPTGWTLVGFAQRNSTVGGREYTFRRVASSETGPYSFTISGFSATTTRNHIGHIYAVSGCDPTTPIDVFSIVNKASTPPIQSQAVTTTKDDCLLLHSVNVSTTPTGGEAWTTATKVSGSGGGNDLITAATEAAPTAGVQSARTATIPNANNGSTTYDYVSSTIALAPPAAAPANTVAPAVSGTAAVGATLTTTNGTWSGSPTSYAYQWKRDGSNISGATASTYTVQSADAGHTVTCAVTATNTAGSASATSNGIAIPAAPVNTVAPAITTDGTPATGETVTVNTGTWTGTGITYTYQWFRNATLLTGETANAYTLTVNDEGQSIRCDVTATNGGAPSGVTASSNVITPAVTAPISDASFTTTFSGGASNTDPALSIGGARGAIYNGGVSGLFSEILGTVAQAGGTFYRVVYIRNTHTISSAASMKAWISQQFADVSGLSLAVAVPSQGVNTTVPALASGTTEPSGVTWTTATTSGAGLDFGTLDPGDYRGIYVRLTVTAGATPTSEADASFRVEGSSA